MIIPINIPSFLNSLIENNSTKLVYLSWYKGITNDMYTIRITKITGECQDFSFSKEAFVYPNFIEQTLKKSVLYLPQDPISKLERFLNE